VTTSYPAPVLTDAKRVVSSLDEITVEWLTQIPSS
jgi:hypothetical protein